VENHSDGSNTDLLRQRLRPVLSRRVGLALAVWGEAGIGKTHTVHELLQESHCRSFSFYATSSIPEWLRTLPRPPKMPMWAESLLGRLMAGEAFDSERTALALGALMAGLAPVILHLEDLHEVDPERLEFVQRLAEVTRSIKGVALLITSRIQPPPAFEVHRLRPLDLRTIQRQLETEAGAVLPSEAVQWIHARAAGNPLFTMEYFRHLARRGFLWSDGLQWRWRTPAADDAPATVEGLIEQLIDQATASPDARTAIEARAVLRRDVSDDLWAQVAGITPPDLRAAKAAFEHWGLCWQGHLTHPLFREVVLTSLSPERARALARRALLAVAERDPLLAIEYVRDARLSAEESLSWFTRAAELEQAAGNPAQAAQHRASAVAYAAGEERSHLAIAASKALSIHNLVEAERMAAEAVRVNPANTVAVFLHARTLAVMGRGSDADQVWQRLPASELNSPFGLNQQIHIHYALGREDTAQHLWRDHPELKASVEADTFRVMALATLDDPEVAAALIEEGLQHARLSQQDRAAILEVQGHLALRRADDGAAADLYSESIKLRIEIGQGQRCSPTHQNRAFALSRMGRQREAIVEIEEAMRLASETADLRMLTRSQLLLSDQLLELGEYHRAEETLLSCQDLLERTPLSLNHRELHGNFCDLYRDWNSSHSSVLALKHGHKALSYAKQLGMAADVPEGLFYAAVSEAKFGNADKALELSLEQSALVKDRHAPRQTYRAAWSKGAALIALNRRAEALGAFQEAHQIAMSCGASIHGHKLGLELAWFTHDLTAARAHLDWFESRGLMNGTNLAHRLFPEFSTEPVHGSGKQSPTSRLLVLGPLRWENNARVEALRGQKRKELLTLLLEARIAGRPEVSRRELIDTMYSGLEEAEGLAGLKNLTYQVRQTLGAGCIATTSSGYALGEVTSDAEAFLRSADTRLWRGAYLEDAVFAGSDENVRDALYTSLHRQAQAVLERDPHEAARLGRVLLGADPYDREALRLTLEALRMARNHRSLQRVYSEASARLLEVSEVLPDTWQAFLESVTVN
jgi:tetratricopeptide (TPR) repeat protein